jgi:2-polyprenyl-6-methoxyphenol hydroxylase-like FAD-dependent oxidoreductase
VLSRLGVDVSAEAVGATPGKGFVVFTDDGSAPIILPYPDGMSGVSLEHESLVTLLRDRASAQPSIDLRLGARVREVVDGSVCVENADGPGGVETISVDRVVGADGRSSVVRRALALKHDATALAYTAGVELRDVTLPFEGVRDTSSSVAPAGLDVPPRRAARARLLRRSARRRRTAAARRSGGALGDVPVRAPAAGARCVQESARRETRAVGPPPDSGPAPTTAAGRWRWRAMRSATSTR